MKTSELSGAALDWAVAKCEGSLAANTNNVFDFKDFNFSPSTNWAQGGPIIEGEKIQILPRNNDWVAVCFGPGKPITGPTPLIAAMRCYVTSLGDNIDIPKELI